LRTTTDYKIKVRYFQRKPRSGFNFSIESIFDDVRKRLKDKIEYDIKICRFYNTGIFGKLYHIAEAGIKQSIHINHITGELHFLNFLMRKKTVILTIHDCGVIYRKKGLAKYIVNLLYLKWPVKKAKFITANSNKTKEEIIKYTNCNPQKITVIPVAVDRIYKPVPKAFNAESPNILHIGTGPNKNLARLIEALKGLDCRLTIIGGMNQNYLEALKKNSIQYINYYNLSQAVMFEQYQKCDILSFISTFEGFGMPIIEANSVERVVITSNLSSMPEVAGDAACLVNPYDVNDIKNGFNKIINDDGYRKILIENGRKNKKRFEGDFIANEYYKLYKKMDFN
jgi:glycosyltransferase involved in cell wall biosynthesis